MTNANAARSQIYAKRFTRTATAATRDQIGAHMALPWAPNDTPRRTWAGRILAICLDHLGSWPLLGAASGRIAGAGWQVAHREARAAQREGDLARAVQRYQQAADLNPGAPVVFHDWAALLEVQGRQEAAIEKYLVVLNLDPEHGAAYDALSRLFRHKGADLQYNWGRILERRGELAEAEGFYRRAVELTPDSGLAARARGRLATLHRPGSPVVAAGGTPIEESAAR